MEINFEKYLQAAIKNRECAIKGKWNSVQKSDYIIVFNESSPSTAQQVELYKQIEFLYGCYPKMICVATGDGATLIKQMLLLHGVCEDDIAVVSVSLDEFGTYLKKYTKD